jgi:hypothetical protein
MVAPITIHPPAHFQKSRTPAAPALEGPLMCRCSRHRGISPNVVLNHINDIEPPDKPPSGQNRNPSSNLCNLCFSRNYGVLSAETT